MADDLAELKRKAVLAHRILTMTGSMGDTTGHVMVRIPGTDEMLIRGRNGADVSPAYVQPRSLRRVRISNAEMTEDAPGWTIPPERHIGTTVFKARPEVGCVIHAHPPAQVLCSIIDADIRPIVGSQNWIGAGMARGGVGVYPRSLLIHSPEIGAAMMAIMGDQDAVLLKAHGNVVAGRTVEEATVRAIRLENLAKLVWQCALAGEQAPEVSSEDWDDHLRPDAGRETGMQGGIAWFWEYYLSLLRERPRIPQESTVDLGQF